MGFKISCSLAIWTPALKWGYAGDCRKEQSTADSCAHPARS